MLKKAFSIALAVITVSWICFVAYSFFGTHISHLQTERLFPIKMLSAFVGIYVLAALYQYSNRNRRSWNFNLTPVRIWAIFGAAFFSVTFSYLFSPVFSGRVDPFPAEFNIMGWFFLISAGLLLLVTYYYSFGEIILKRFQFRSLLDKFVFSTGAGIMATVGVMYVLGTAHLLYPVAIWILVVGVLAWRWKTALEFLKNLRSTEIPVRTNLFAPVNFLFIFLTLILASNMMELIRPIPGGWDDTTVYLNFPRLVAQYHHLLSLSGHDNHWLMAAFPYMFFDNTTMMMEAQLFGGFLGILATVALGRRFFTFEIGVIGTTVIYLTPMFMWQSAMDMKPDPIVFYLATLGVFALFEWITINRSAEEAGGSHKDGLKWLALSGVFAGFIFGTKFATMFMVFAMVASIAMYCIGPFGALTVLLVQLSISWSAGPPELTALASSKTFLLIALVCALIAIFRHRTKVLTFGLSFLVFAGSAALTFSPWAVKNAIEAKSVSVNKILNGLPTEQWVILKNKALTDWGSACVATSPVEEIDRYVGFDSGLDKFILLPWKATLNLTQNAFYVIIGFLFLALLPTFLGIAIWQREKNALSGVAAIAWFAFWIFWILRIKLNITGDLNSSTFTPQLIFDYGLMSVLALTACVYAVAKIRNPIMTAIVILTVVSWIFWVLVGKGIIWYNLPGFLPLVILIGYLVVNSPPILRVVGWIAIFFCLATQVNFRGLIFGAPAVLAYSYGLTNYERTVENIVPGDLFTSNTINAHPETETEKNYVYRINTTIQYFIQKNDRRVFSDDQLDFFSCLNLAGNDDETLGRLRLLGFRYMIYDLHTPEYEKDPNGTLHQKVKKFIDWANRMNQGGRIHILSVNKERNVFLELL